MRSRPALIHLRRAITPLGLSLLIASVLLAGPLERRLTAITYSIKNGLPSTQINALLQDSRGYLWVGTNSGLSRYDGSTFRTFSVVDGLPNNWVTAIAEDPREPGTVVVGTIRGGICRLRGDSLQTVIPRGSVSALAVDRGGTIWTVLDDTLFRCDREGLRVVIATATPANRSEILIMPDGGVTVGMDRTVTWYDGQGRETGRLDICRGPHDQVNSLMADRRGRLWAVTTGWGVVRLSREGVEARIDLPAAQPFFCVQDFDGTMWLRTSRGLLAFPEDTPPDGEGRSYTIGDEHPVDWVGPVMIDREETMWIGTWSEGLLKVTDGLMATFSPANLLSGINDSSGHLWFGRSGTLVELYPDDHGDWRSSEYRIADETGPYRIEEILIDPSGNLWVALAGKNTPVELRCLSVKSVNWKSSHPKQLLRLNLPLEDFLSFMIDGERHVWVALRKGGVVVYDESGRELRRLSIEDGLGPGPVRVLLRDRAGTVWIGSWAEGLASIGEDDLRKGRLRFLSTSDGLPDSSIRSMDEDSRGALWIGTRYGGVVELHNHQRKLYSVYDGLRSNSIWKIKGDDRGIVWLATDAGIERIDAGGGKPLPMLPEFLGYRAERLGVVRDQFVWAASSKGIVTTYDFRNRRPARIPPPVHIVAFQMNGDVRRSDEPLVFPHDSNSCAIEFAGITFRDEGGTRYVYRMIGADTLWTQPGFHRSVSYASLHPGEYRFEVRAINSDGVESDQPATVSFIILPPIWKTWWFIALSVAVGLAGVFSAIRYQVNKLLEMERLRTRIASDLHDDIGSGLTRIAILSDKLARQTSAPRIGEGGDAFSTRETIRSVGVIARELHDSMGDIVWSIDGSKASFGDLIDRLKVFAVEICEGADLTLSWRNDGIDPDARLSPSVRRAVLLVGKEALTNIVRHAECTGVSVVLGQEPGRLRLTITDDGHGFDPQTLPRMYGLRNMADRVRTLGGTFDIRSSPGRGTTIDAVIPL